MEPVMRLIRDTEATGGGTVSMNGSTVPEKGYFVGGVVPSAHGTRTDLLNVSAVWDFVIKNVSHLTNPFKFLGAWVDSETDTVWLDVSEYVIDRDDAMQLASDRDEIAIWDISNSAEIRVK